VKSSFYCLYRKRMFGFTLPRQQLPGGSCFLLSALWGPKESCMLTSTERIRTGSGETCGAKAAQQTHSGPGTEPETGSDTHTTLLLDHLTTGPPYHWTTLPLDHLTTGPPYHWTTLLLDHLTTGPPYYWTTLTLSHVYVCVQDYLKSP